MFPQKLKYAASGQLGQLRKGKNMKLDKLQRVMLVNQYLILENLYPNEADKYARLRKALERSGSANLNS